MDKFGVCNYDFVAFEPIIENLAVFDQYIDASDEYMRRFLEYRAEHSIFPNDLWIVYISDGRIVQFDQLNRISKCKIVGIE